MDDKTPLQRSRNMAKIKGKDTKPGEAVRKYLFKQGFRYRKNDKRYPGKPDIVLPKYKTIIFMNGYFWHQHKNCKYAAVPKSNEDYWFPKLKHNVERDENQIQAIEKLGFKVIVVWECELRTKEKRDNRLSRLIEEIKRY